MSLRLDRARGSGTGRAMAVGALAVAACALWPTGPALAYVGPGLGAGALAVVIGLLGSVLLAVVAVVWYPLRRLLRKRRQRADTADPGARDT